VYLYGIITLRPLTKHQRRAVLMQKAQCSQKTGNKDKSAGQGHHITLCRIGSTTSKRWSPVWHTYTKPVGPSLCMASSTRGSGGALQNGLVGNSQGSVVTFYEFQRGRQRVWFVGDLGLTKFKVAWLVVRIGLAWKRLRGPCPGGSSLTFPPRSVLLNSFALHEQNNKAQHSLQIVADITWLRRSPSSRSRGKNSELFPLKF
jgi:hypothetical protein